LKRVLVKYALFSTAVVLSLAFIAALLLLGLKDAIGVVISGALAAADFVGIIYLTTGLLEPSREPKGKVGLVFLLVGKFGLVFAVFWVVLKWLSPIGVALGIAAGILGFTWGVAKASSSPEGQAAIEAEERRIEEELNRRG
jgi:hypothetical protein